MIKKYFKKSDAKKSGSFLLIPMKNKWLKTKDEREAFRNQIKYLRSGDTVIFDRGYY